MLITTKWLALWATFFFASTALAMPTPFVDVVVFVWCFPMLGCALLAARADAAWATR